MLTYSVETSQQLSNVLLRLKIAGVAARCVVRSEVLLIDIPDPGRFDEPELFALIRQAVPSAQRET